MQGAHGGHKGHALARAPPCGHARLEFGGLRHYGNAHGRRLALACAPALGSDHARRQIPPRHLPSLPRRRGHACRKPDRQGAAQPGETRRHQTRWRAIWSRGMRAGHRRQHGGIDAFTQEYALSSEEGVVLMCLAEALLRVPDAETADRLIRDKIGGGDWERHLGQSESLFVNASTWALMLTGRVVRARRRRPMGFRRHLEAAGGALGRTGHPPGRRPSDAHSRPPIRAWTHDRGGAEGMRGR